MITRWIGVFLLLCIPSMPAQAVLLYDAATLSSWEKGHPKGDQGTREEAAQANLNDFILKKLTPKEMDLVRGVRLKFHPLYDENPLQSTSDAAERTIYLPVQTIKFYDELCIAAAWLLKREHGYSVESIAYYMSILKYKPEALKYKPESILLLTPRKALQIPDDALNDPEVDKSSQILFNYGLMFIMAHEVGHIRYQHKKQTDFIKAQDQERQADNFAIEIFRRQRTVPPIFIYFLAATYYSANPGDFKSDAEWRDYITRKEDHPFTADRLHSLASELRKRPEEFSSKEPEKAVVRDIATRIDGIARILEDAEFQRAVTDLFTPASNILDVKTLLRPRRVGEPIIPIAPQK